jgi:hypothetical protein
MQSGSSGRPVTRVGRAYADGVEVHGHDLAGDLMGRLTFTETSRLATACCAIVGQNLSREEWGLYLPPDMPYRPTCAEWPSG